MRRSTGCGDFACAIFAACPEPEPCEVKVDTAATIEGLDSVVVSFGVCGPLASNRRKTGSTNRPLTGQPLHPSPGPQAPRLYASAVRRWRRIARTRPLRPTVLDTGP